MIRLEGITKSFGSLQVLRGIDLEIKKGEVVSIVGPSGGAAGTADLSYERCGQDHFVADYGNFGHAR